VIVVITIVISVRCMMYDAGGDSDGSDAVCLREKVGVMGG